MAVRTVSTLDIIALVTFVVGNAAYHARVYCRARGSEPSVMIGYMLANGRTWVDRWMERGGTADITLVVQTLRNTIIASTFLGTVAFQLAASTINEIAGERGLGLDVDSLRATVLSALLFASFLNFAITIRSCSHLGFLFGAQAGQLPVHAAVAALAPAAPADVELASTVSEAAAGGGAALVRQAEVRSVGGKAKALMRLVSLHFSLGLRFLYVSIPVVFFNAGAVAFLVSTLCMLGVLTYVDRMVGS